MTPKQSNCMPPIIQIDATVEVQPPIVKPVYFRIMKTISAIKLTKNIKNPKQVIIRIGLILKEVIPSNANANILLKGYLDSPANLLSLSYSTVVDLKPIKGIIPRKNKFTSSNCAKTSKDALLISL